MATLGNKQNRPGERARAGHAAYVRRKHRLKIGLLSGEDQAADLGLSRGM